MINTKSRTTTIAARQELIDGGYLDFTPGIKAAQHLPSPLSGRDGGWQPPPDDLEGDFLAEFKEDPTSYFGYTEPWGWSLRRPPPTCGQSSSQARPWAIR